MIYALIAYAVAMTIANLSVAALGPQLWLVGLNAFILIGMDLSLRDWLHLRLSRWQMLALILGSGVLTYLLNPAAGRIAAASAAAFIAAALADWLVFSRLKGSWFKRANASNAAGAAVDSMLFPLLAWGALLPEVVAMMFVSKMAGGAVWAYLLTTKRATG